MCGSAVKNLHTHSLFAELRVRSLAMKYNAEFTEAGRSHFKPFVGQTSSSFETVGGPTLVSHVFARLSTLCFIPKIFDITGKFGRRRKTTKCIIDVLAPNLFGGRG